MAFQNVRRLFAGQNRVNATPNAPSVGVRHIADVIPIFGEKTLQMQPFRRIEGALGAEIEKSKLAMSLEISDPASIPPDFFTSLTATIEDSLMDYEITAKVIASEVDGTKVTLRTARLKNVYGNVWHEGVTPSHTAVVTLTGPNGDTYKAKLVPILLRGI